MATKKLLGEQILYRYYGGYIDTAGAVQLPDVYKAIEQKINSMFGIRQFSVNLPSGGTIPDGLCLATYEDISVVSFNSGNSKSTLPVMPISLPRNAGINEIRPVINQVPTGDKILGNPIIPLQAGQGYLLQADRLLNDLLGQFGYEPVGKSVVYTSDLTTLGVTKVDMKLVVMDIGLYGVNDMLPVPSDYEEQIITEVLSQFAPVSAENGIVNNYTTANQKANSQ